MYFTSHFDKLTEEVQFTFNEKQKSYKNIKLDKISNKKFVCTTWKRGFWRTWLEHVEEETQNILLEMEIVILFVQIQTARIVTKRWVIRITLKISQSNIDENIQKRDYSIR
jgi:hypothetical protein